MPPVWGDREDIGHEEIDLELVCGQFNLTEETRLICSTGTRMYLFLAKIILLTYSVKVKLLTSRCWDFLNIALPKIDKVL